MQKADSSFQKQIGLKYYQNNGDFVGGKIRQSPEDFVVKEKSNFDYIKKEPEEKDLDYLVVRVKAKNWDTNQLIKELSDQLGVSKKRISFAGTKDKRAITAQLFTLYKVKKQDLERIDLNNVEFTNFGYCKNQINIGDLVGNKFEIKLRSVDNPKRAEDIKKLLQKNGIINYYGSQRFGGIRPITHLVGEQIVRENYEEAIKIYLANDYDQENQNTQEIRKELRKNWGDKEAYKKALKNFPNYLRYERTMLHSLYENPDSPVGALNNLPKNLLNLFIHAYQSYLFNKTINERIKRNISLRKPIMGDVVCYTDLETGIPNRNVTERVTEKNREKIEEMIEKRKSYVTAPLFGKKTKQALGEMGKIEEKILEKENIRLTDFEIKKIPEISSSGLRREIITFPNFDSIKKTKSTVTLRFFLPKGSYATCVTREFRGELNGK